MFHSPVIRADFKASCAHVKVKHLEMKRAIDTRWNSLSECIERAVLLREALEHLFSRSKYDKDAKPGLRRYKLTAEEWTIVSQLNTLLVVRSLPLPSF